MRHVVKAPRWASLERRHWQKQVLCSSVQLLILLGLSLSRLKPDRGKEITPGGRGQLRKEAIEEERGSGIPIAPRRSLSGLSPDAATRALNCSTENAAQGLRGDRRLPYRLGLSASDTTL